MSRRGWHLLPDWSKIPIAATPPEQPAIPPSSAARAHVDATVRAVLGALAPGGRYACPVRPCDWYADVPGLSVAAADADLRVATRVTYTGVTTAAVEKELREHLESHDLEDWLFTVRDMRVDLADLEEQLDKADERERQDRFRRERLTIPSAELTDDQVSVMTHWQTEILCEQGAKIVRAIESIELTAETLTTRMHLDGQLHGIRIALCLARGLVPARDADKEGPADDLISTWMEQHPEPEDSPR